MAAAVRHGASPRKTIFARLSSGGEVVRVADRAVMVWCQRHLRGQSPLFARAKKAQKITEYRDTAPLMQELKIYADERLLPSFFYSQAPDFSQFVAVNCGVFWLWDQYTLPTWGLGFVMCLMRQMLPTARGVPGSSPIHLLSDSQFQEAPTPAAKMLMTQRT